MTVRTVIRLCEDLYARERAKQRRRNDSGRNCVREKRRKALSDNCTHFSEKRIFEYGAHHSGGSYQKRILLTPNGAKKGVGLYDPTKQRKERAAFREERSPKEDGYTWLSYP